MIVKLPINTNGRRCKAQGTDIVFTFSSSLRTPQIKWILETGFIYEEFKRGCNVIHAWPSVLKNAMNIPNSLYFLIRSRETNVEFRCEPGDLCYLVEIYMQNTFIFKHINIWLVQKWVGKKTDSYFFFTTLCASCSKYFGIVFKTEKMFQQKLWQ